MTSEYTLLCPMCPPLSLHAETLRAALRMAKRETGNHVACKGEVWVAFEGACQRGQPRLWYANGQVFGWKGIEPPPIKGTLDGHRFELHFPSEGMPYVEYPDADIIAEFDYEHERTLWRDADTGEQLRVDHHPKG